MTRLSIAISPPLISSSPHNMRSKVDLPQPEGPTSTTNSPSLISRLRSASTFCLPSYDLVRCLTLTFAMECLLFLLYSARSQAANQLTGEDHVHDQDRDNGQRQRCQHRIPVGHVLADKLLHA